MGVVSGFVQGIAQDYAIDTGMEKWDEFAGKHFNVKDPYRYETPDGETKKLKLRDSATKEEQKCWKWIQKRAWVDDKCFLGCYPVDCGIGLGPIVVLLPAIGPYLMYLVHVQLVNKAVKQFHLDASTQAKLHANIIFDLLLTFPPVIGSFLAWLNGCSTRNAAIIHNQVSKMLLQRETQNQAAQHTQQQTQGYPSHSNTNNLNYTTNHGSTSYQQDPTSL
ncbi:hypothetical protein CANINC_004653 [Pichia inconspicua]|uniref:Uncharacterized protein n=1 Tax=Pichia inconspicua TaxID=52247 RepID=A0A4T0WVV4_9ASCO|nr:hypothetical protein CANINC_004653 [[Candida] inconspicua]